MARIRIRNYLVKLTLMVFALALGGSLSLWTVDELYRDALIDRYYLPLKHLQSNLQTAASYGVDPTSTSRVVRDLQRTQRVLDEQFEKHDARIVGTRTKPRMMLVDSQGRIARDGAGQAGSEVLSGSLREAWLTPNGPGESAASIRHRRVDNGFAIPMKLFDGQSNWLASLVLVIDDHPIEAQADGLFREGVVVIAVFVMLALPIYALLLTLVLPRRPHPSHYRQKRVFWLSICFAVLSQLSLSMLVGLVYDREFGRTNVEKSELLAGVLRTDVDSALQRNVRLDDLDFRHFPWQRLAREFRVLGSVDVVDPEGRLLARVTRTSVDHYDPDPASQQAISDPGFREYAATALPLRQGDRATGVLRVRLSSQGLTSAWLELIGDSLTANMVIVLLLVELILLFSLFADPTAHGGKPTIGKFFGLMRPAIFLFIFGADLSMSFVPLHMATLYEPIFGLSPNLVIGLPISVEFLCVGIAILYAGGWVDRVGWRRPFLVGIVLACLAALYSWAATTMLHFVLSRAILGIGIGFTLLASQAYVISYGRSTSKARGLAQLFAALYGGSIGGSVTGAILAERLGFSIVFFIGAVMTGLAVVYVLTMLPRTTRMGELARKKPPRPTPTTPMIVVTHPLLGFLTNRVMLSLVVFSSLPVAIAAVGFLNYFTPVYLNSVGASQSTIGQVLMLYGACMVFIGPWVGRTMDTPERKRLAVFCGCLLSAAAFLIFGMFEGVVATAVAVVVLGVSHSMVLSSQSAYALSLKATAYLGEGKAMGIFRSTGRIGQMLGPFVFGWVIASADIEWAMVILGYLYLATALLFLFCTIRDRRMLMAI